VIPAGLTSANFQLRGMEDYLADGDQLTVPVAAAAGGYASVTQTMTVTDSTITPTVIMDITGVTTINEVNPTNSTTATITTNRVFSTDQAFVLISHDASELSVPSGVIIPANTNTATFTISAVQDGVNDDPIPPPVTPLDGTQTGLLVSAYRTGFPVANNAAEPITVTDAADRNISNLAVGGENQQESEMQVAVNPNDPLHIVAVTNNLANDNINVYRSFDGGVTWARTTITDATDGRNAATDRVGASVAFDSLDNLYVSYMTQEPANRAVMALTSVNGGVSFPTVALVALGNATSLKPGFVTADNSPTSAFQDNVYVTYIEAEASDRIRISTSIDSGVTFAAGVRVDNPAVNVIGYDYAVPAVGPTGQVYVVWEDDTTNAPAASIFADVSTDGGASFGTDVLIATPVLRGPIPATYALPAQADRGILAAPTIDVHRTSGRIYIGYADLAAGGSADTDIYVQHGTTFG